MKKTVFIFGIICLAFGSYAQKTTTPYSSAFGGRIEINTDRTFLGFTYKHYMDQLKSYEVMALSDFDRGIEFYGFLQYNGTVPDFPPKLRWIVGGGANLGTWNDDSFVLGIDGMLGVEYSFTELPLNLGLDWKPVLNLVTKKDDRFWPSKFGISIRYTIK